MKKVLPPDFTLTSPRSKEKPAMVVDDGENSACNFLAEKVLPRENEEENLKTEENASQESVERECQAAEEPLLGGMEDQVENGPTCEEKKDEEPFEVSLLKAKGNWKMSIPKNEKERESNVLFKEVRQVLKRRGTPFNVSGHALKAATRYKGMLIGVCHRKLLAKSEYVFFCLAETKLQGRIDILCVDPGKPTGSDVILSKSLGELFSVRVTNLQDAALATDLLDAYTQSLLLEIKDSIGLCDVVSISEGGMFVFMSEMKDALKLQKIISLLFMMADSVSAVKK